MSALFRFMDWSLRAKMAALLVVASLLPLGLATFVNIREARERLLANTAALLAARGDHLADRIDAFHRGYQRSAGRISRLPNAAALCQARPEEIERFQGGLRAVLEVWPASDANIVGVAILDSAGSVRVATEEALIGLDLSYHGHVREALRGAAITSDIYFAEPQVVFEPRIAYLDPVRGTDGKIAGTAVLWIRASALWDVMKASNELAGAGSFAVLFDREGIRIGHTFSEDMIFHPGGRLDHDRIEALVAERRFGEKTRALLEDVRPFPEQFDRARSEAPDRGLFRGFAPVNQKWNYGVARRFETVRWTVFYMIPEQSLNTQIAVMTRQKIVFTAVITLIALLAGTLFAALILKPVGSLSTATKLIAGGDLAARVETTRDDELGRLGASFNSMAERIEVQAMALKKARDDLEVRVQERTADLGQANESLRNTQARLNSTLAAGSIGTWTWDIVSDRLVADEFTACMFSIEAKAAAKGLPAEAYLKVIDEEDRPRVVNALDRAIQSCGQYDIEYRVRRHDGEFRWLQARGRVECDVSGKALSFHGAVMDIAERKQAEETSERLRDAEKEQLAAVEAGRAKNEFLAMMSHELRTPLNAVIGFTGTLLMELPGPITPEQRKQLETIKGSARHQLSLINDLLDLAKIESGRFTLKLEPVDCAKVVREVAETLRPMAEGKALDLHVDLPNGATTVQADNRALKQILINLLNNAIKFTDKGEVRIAVGGSNGKTEIAVSDTGGGISAEDQKRLFRPFSRLDRGSRYEEGSGLGLHLSRQLATLLDGEIVIESQPEKGSKFTLIFGGRQQA
jgi:signal transduction histidine kinase